MKHASISQKNVEKFNRNVPHRSKYIKTVFRKRKPLPAETAALPKTVRQYRIIHRASAEVRTRTA